ncbi:MAG TPA: ATP synthase subunit I [Chloroflexota bacterium]|nr:ATP synthase subunit I [Chloroflexota bacterium]HZP23715.1 ATP synthase subunit I [Terriglobales bacterium]
MSTLEPTFAAEAFLDRALPRIRRILLALAVAGTLACLIFFRRQVAAGFVVGAVISWLNQRWLERAIVALGERITQQQSGERGGLIVVRAMLRYLLIAAGAYVIFNVSLMGLYGFLGGLFLPIAAIACEVAAEVFVMLRGS